MTHKAKESLGELFDLFFSYPELLPEELRQLIKNNKGNEAKKARIVCDYISSMTDPYFIEEYTKLFDVKVRP